ncbi:hypothetical protein JZ751_012577 [Albula glossodonta]|uniref:snRNA-activating protein complex subunit 3 n=1 Tax=Albula glossodonta TaxID=121402 RepID=A0A8T2P603_9TELE|nr:hypothetical protein JZ751_012577 [Albula glossodonta]
MALGGKTEHASCTSNCTLPMMLEGDAVSFPSVCATTGAQHDQSRCYSDERTYPKSSLARMPWANCCFAKGSQANALPRSESDGRIIRRHYIEISPAGKTFMQLSWWVDFPGLSSISIQQITLKLLPAEVTGSCCVIVTAKLSDHVFTKEESLAMGRRPLHPADLVPEGEIILTFRIHYPLIFERFKYVRPYQTLQVLGSQKLTELRDAICCVSDLQVSGEFSNTPDIAPDFISKDHYKSAFFYLEGIFYNDMRYPDCRELSE